jgi:hypothetical protein
MTRKFHYLLAPICISFLLNQIEIELNFNLIPIKSKFHSMLLNLIESEIEIIKIKIPFKVACNVIQYFHSIGSLKNYYPIFFQ